MQHWRAREGNRAREQTSRVQLRAGVRSAVMTLKLERGCIVCGYNEHPAALQFDHLDPETKNFTIANVISGGMCISTLLEEIEKCEVVCANHHAVRTYERKYECVKE